jgi:hypothetical protein
MLIPKNFVNDIFKKQSITTDTLVTNIKMEVDSV